MVPTQGSSILLVCIKNPTRVTLTMGQSITTDWVTINPTYVKQQLKKLKVSPTMVLSLRKRTDSSGGTFNKWCKKSRLQSDVADYLVSKLGLQLL